MKTRIFTKREELPEAAALLLAGELAAVPTETVYGLAGSGLDRAAVEKIYAVKGRPQVKPLSLMVPDAEAMERYCVAVPPQAKLLASRFWPGPLTLVLRAGECVPAIVRAGGETVGLRCPDHPLTLELLRLAGVPFAAPSANPSGEDSPKTAEQVRAYFDGKIAAIVDGGPCGLGRESTILDMSALPFRVLRAGALSAEDVADALVDGMQIVGVTGGTGSGKTTWKNGALSRSTATPCITGFWRATGSFSRSCGGVSPGRSGTDAWSEKPWERSCSGMRTLSGSSTGSPIEPLAERCSACCGSTRWRAGPWQPWMPSN